MRPTSREIARLRVDDDETRCLTSPNMRPTSREIARLRVDDDETRCLTSPNHESDRLEQIARLRGKLSGLRAARNIGGLTPDQLQKIDDLSAATMGFLRRAHQRPHS